MPRFLNLDWLVGTERARVLAFIEAHYVVEANGCWRWTGSFKQHSGPDKRRSLYGRLQIPNPDASAAMGFVWVSAHRASYMLFVGAIPQEEPTLHHICQNEWCINFEHLEPKTIADNIYASPGHLASLNIAKQFCPQGHPYDEVNTMPAHAIKAKPGRKCRECGRIACMVFYLMKTKGLTKEEARAQVPERTKDISTGKWNKPKLAVGVTLINAQVTHCPKGHPYNEENTYVHDGGRYCRICVRARNKAFKAAKRAAKLQGEHTA